MTYRDAARRFAQLGCQELRRAGGGSHRKWTNPETGAATVLPDWRGKDLKLGTLRAAVKQLGLDWIAFEQA